MRTFVIILVLACAVNLLDASCTPAERATIVSDAAKAAPCAEACAPLIEEVIASSSDSGAVSVLAFSVPPPRNRLVAHRRRCTAWEPVAPREAGSEAGP